MHVPPSYQPNDLNLDNALLLTTAALVREFGGHLKRESLNEEGRGATENLESLNIQIYHRIWDGGRTGPNDTAIADLQSCSRSLRQNDDSNAFV
jgi:hypothetical protein